jgi:hypothetical protein
MLLLLLPLLLLQLQLLLTLLQLPSTKASTSKKADASRLFYCSMFTKLHDLAPGKAFLLRCHADPFFPAI